MGMVVFSTSKNHCICSRGILYSCTVRLWRQSFVIKKSEMIPETMDSLMRVFAWSCNVMLSGETPLTDYHQPPRHLNGGGVTLANGYRGCLTQVRGDWEFFVALFHFPRWDQEVMCPFCDATSEAGRPWSDCSLDAGWRDTIWTHTTYMEHLRLVGRPIPVFFLPIGGIIGLRLCNVMADTMHTVDLGVNPHIVGNILWYFVVVLNSFGGATYAERIKRCASDLKAWYSRPINRGRQRLNGKLTTERVRAQGDWPKLKAKAAAARHMAYYALDLCRRFAQIDSLEEFTRVNDRLCLGVFQLPAEF